jgi:hypothetical protein
MLGYQVTYKQTDHDCNRGTTHSDILHFPSVATMALCRHVLQEDDILCVLYADTRSSVSDFSDNESSDSDSDSEVSATSSHKQLRSSVVVVTNDNETSTREEESSDQENCDDKTSDVWCKTDKKPSK